MKRKTTKQKINKLLGQIKDLVEKNQMCSFELIIKKGAEGLSGFPEVCIQHSDDSIGFHLLAYLWFP